MPCPLIGAALATFGGAGVLPLVAIFISWGAIYSNRARLSAYVKAGVVLLFILPTFALIFEMELRSRTIAEEQGCRSKLRQIGLALHNYHDTWRTFPPRYFAAPDGTPRGSWRISICPFLESSPFYSMYDIDEPWDAPSNRVLAQPYGVYYQCPIQFPSNGMTDRTSYFGVIGSQAAFAEIGPRSLASLRAGASHTLMVIEDHDTVACWTEPHDVDISSARRRFQSTHLENGAHAANSFFFSYGKYRNILLADISVRTFNDGPLDWSRVTPDGTLDPKEEPHRTTAPDIDQFQRKLDNWWRLAIFILLAMLPLPWVWLVGKRQEQKQAEDPIPT